MTTIAYKDGVIAYDSYSCRDGVIIDRVVDKHHERHGVHFFMCGATCDFDEFFSAYLGGRNPSCDCEVEGLVLDGGVLYHSAVDDKLNLWRSKLRVGCSFAIGSGANFALAAMDCGCTAVDAVMKAIDRDCFSGGNIGVFRIDND